MHHLPATRRARQGLWLRYPCHCPHPVRMGAGSDRRHSDMLQKISTMKRLSILLILMAAASAIAASARSEVRFGNESADTTAITALLDNAPRQYANPEELTAFFARSFIGTPYAAHTLEAPEEILTVRIDSLDCTTFVETAMALAFTVLEKRSSCVQPSSHSIPGRRNRRISVAPPLHLRLGCRQ